MTFDHVSLGDPHIEAHNAERDFLNKVVGFSTGPPTLTLSKSFSATGIDGASPTNIQLAADAYAPASVAYNYLDPKILAQLPLMPGYAMKNNPGGFLALFLPEGHWYSMQISMYATLTSGQAAVSDGQEGLISFGGDGFPASTIVRMTYNSKAAAAFGVSETMFFLPVGSTASGYGIYYYTIGGLERSPTDASIPLFDIQISGCITQMDFLPTA